MNIQLSDLLENEGGKSVLQDVRDIFIKRKVYDENNFKCKLEQVEDGIKKIVIQYGEISKEYFSKTSDQGLAVAKPWINDFMNDLEFGKFD